MHVFQTVHIHLGHVLEPTQRNKICLSRQISLVLNLIHRCFNRVVCLLWYVKYFLLLSTKRYWNWTYVEFWTARHSCQMSFRSKRHLTAVALQRLPIWAKGILTGSQNYYAWLYFIEGSLSDFGFLVLMGKYYCSSCYTNVAHCCVSTK